MQNKNDAGVLEDKLYSPRIVCVIIIIHSIEFSLPFLLLFRRQSLL